MTGSNSQNLQSPQFKTPDPNALKQDARNVPAEERHSSQHEANSAGDLDDLVQGEADAESDPTRAAAPTVGDEQIIQANLSGR